MTLSKRQINWYQESFLGCDDKELGKAGLEIIKAYRHQERVLIEVEKECQNLRRETAHRP